MARVLLRSSAARVHDSPAYRKMDVTRERSSRILELREVLLSFQTGFNLVTAAVVCAVQESISGLEPSSVITEPRYLKLEEQAGFRTGKSTIEQIFNLRILCQKYLQHQQDLYICHVFTDFKKALDRV